jgi:hypothetical protein
VVVSLVCSFLLISGCAMLSLYGAEGERGRVGGDARSKTASQSGKVAEPKLGLLKEQKNALGLGGKNEKKDVASLGVAFGRLNLRRMCDASRHRGRYTEPRESLKKGSLRLGRDSDCSRWSPAVFESIPVNPRKRSSAIFRLIRLLCRRPLFRSE